MLVIAILAIWTAASLITAPFVGRFIRVGMTDDAHSNVIPSRRLGAEMGALGRRVTGDVLNAFRNQDRVMQVQVRTMHGYVGDYAPIAVPDDMAAGALIDRRVLWSEGRWVLSDHRGSA